MKKDLDQVLNLSSWNLGQEKKTFNFLLCDDAFSMLNRELLEEEEESCALQLGHAP